MWGFKKKEKRTHIPENITLEQVILGIAMGNITVTTAEAMNIPAVESCVDLISDTVAMLPIKLYQKNDKKVSEMANDARIKMLNCDTGDTMDAFQMKKAMIRDYLLAGNGYVYINRGRNNVKSLHYVDERVVSANIGVDPIFKDYDIFVNGKSYRSYDFVKVIRNTKNGITGIGVVEENSLLLAVVYNSLKYENMLVKTGGNKKGFLKAVRKLSEGSVQELKKQWNSMYKTNEENVIVLNEGLDFKEASNTFVEMQLNENKKTNSNEICKIFKVPPALLDGNATESEYGNFIKIVILSILKAFETALNKELLLSSERGTFYFAFDTSDLMRGDIEKRFQAYGIASQNGIMQIDEIRSREDLEPLGLNFIKLGLQDVLYNPVTKEIYTPNTNKTADMNSTNLKTKEKIDSINDLKGGEEDEN